MIARRSLALLPLVPLALALVACGDDDPAGDAQNATTVPASSTPSTPGSSTPASTAPPTSAPPTTAAAPELDGREFVSTAVVGYELVPDSAVRLTFDGDQIGAAGGCNQQSSTWALDGDVLTVEQMVSTMMACEPAALMDQDTWVASFLTSDPVVTTTGDELTLTVGTSSMTLVDVEVAEPDLDLEGPTWSLESIVSADAVSSVPVGVRTPTLRLLEGQVTLDTGCNTGTGTYQLASAEATELTFSPIALTRIGCDEATSQVEAAITTTLDGVVSFEIDSNQLTLTKGNQGLIYRGA